MFCVIGEVRSDYSISVFLFDISKETGKRRACYVCDLVRMPVLLWDEPM